MFGFLRHCRNNAEYQQAYRRCCQFQHIEYGVPSLAFLSYEAVFIYQLGVDCGLVDSEKVNLASSNAENDRRCCRLQASRRMLNDHDAWLARFAASFGVLLGKIKIDDDIRDNGSLAARLAGFTLRKSHRKAMRYFESIDSHFARKVKQFVDQHHRLEVPGSNHAIEQYAKPTGMAFGYLFELLGHATFQNSGKKTEFLGSSNQIGQNIGKAIIAYDCAIDLERDKKRGDFNPLKDQQQVHASLAFSSRCLLNASELIAGITPSCSGRILTSQKILAGRAKAISGCMQQVATCFSVSAAKTLLGEQKEPLDPLAAPNDDEENKNQVCLDGCCCDCCSCPSDCGSFQKNGCCDGGGGGGVGDCGGCDGCCDCGGCDCGC